VAVSIRSGNEVSIGRAEKNLKSIGIEDVIFFDSRSEGCWKNPTAEYLEEKKKQSQVVNGALNRVLRKPQ